jgi:hypothetical protein
MHETQTALTRLEEARLFVKDERGRDWTVVDVRYDTVILGPAFPPGTLAFYVTSWTDGQHTMETEHDHVFYYAGGWTRLSEKQSGSTLLSELIEQIRCRADP